MNSHRRVALAAATLTASALLAADAAAQVGTLPPDTDLDLEFRAGLNWTDNLGREPDGESQTFGSVGTTIDFSREAARLRAGLSGQLDYYHYDSDRFDNELVGRIDGLLGFSLVPQRLDWMIENRFGQVATDPFAAESPENREYLNVFETGPDVYLPLGARTTAGGSARYTDRRWQDSEELDSEILAGELRLIRQLSPTQQLGVAAGMRSIDFDGEENPRYEVYSAYASYQRELATGEVGLDVGANRLKVGGRSDTGLLLRANWTREITARSTLALSVGREFQDAGDQLGGDSLAQTGFGGDGALTGDPYVNTFAAANYTLLQNRATFAVGAGWSRDRYDSVTALDREALTGTASVEYQISRLLTGEAAATFRREEFPALGGDAVKEAEGTLALSRLISRQVDVSLRYLYARRSFDIGPGFTENRVSLLVRWYPGRS